MDPTPAKKYTSKNQQVRVITENWVRNELYCPSCSRIELDSVRAGKPLHDFQCNNCDENFELKSTGSEFKGKVMDSAYSVKIRQIAEGKNPSFLFLHYEPRWRVRNLFAVPKHVFHPELIEARKPLGPEHSRRGHILSSILLDEIPSEARINVVVNRAWRPQKSVTRDWRTLTAFGKVSYKMRGWTLDVYDVINRLEEREFTLSQIYDFDEELGDKHPENKHVRAKIRQQLQKLRDIGLIDFKERGVYQVKRGTRQSRLADY